MAPHSSTLAWKIPWMEEPGRLQSVGSLRVRHDWATSLSLFTFMHWRRKWQPSPLFLPGESQGRGSLVGCHLWDPTELDMTEPDHLTCLLRNLYAGQEATVRTWHGTTDWFQIEKGYVMAVYCHPAYLTYLTHRKRLWCWEELGAGGEGDDRGWDGWMASLTRWTWVWVNSGSWWWTGRPGVLRFMGSQRVRHDWATELNWTDTPVPSKFPL